MTGSVRREVASLVASALVLGALSGNAWADDAVAHQAAQQDFKDGYAQMMRGDYEGARISFVRSFAEWPTASALQDLAYTEVMTGRCVEALDHFRTLLQSPGVDRTFATQKVPGLQQQCARQVGHLRIVAPANATLTVDGHKVRDWSDGVDVLPGSHEIVSKLGERSEPRTVQVPAGEVVDVRFDGGPPAPGTHAASSPPPVETLAGSQAPPAESAPKPSIVVGSGGSLAERPASSRSFLTPRRIAGIVTAGAGIASLGASGGFALAAKTRSDDAAADRAAVGSSLSACSAAPSPPRCSSLRSDTDAQNHLRTTSEVFLGLGVAAAVAGVVLIAWPDAPESHAARAPTRSWAIAPLFPRQGAGLSVEGGF